MAVLGRAVATWKSCLGNRQWAPWGQASDEAGGWVGGLYWPGVWGRQVCDLRLLAFPSGMPWGQVGALLDQIPSDPNQQLSISLNPHTWATAPTRP